MLKLTGEWLGSTRRTFARDDGKEGVAFVGSFLVSTARGPQVMEVSAFGDSVPAAQAAVADFKDRAAVTLAVYVGRSGKLMFDVA